MANNPSKAKNNIKVKKADQVSVLPEEEKQLNWVQSVTFPIRDVLIASLDKGQFIIASLLFLIGLYIWKLPEGDITKFGDGTLERMESNQIWGWFLFLLVSCGWYIHNKTIVKVHDKEVKRLTDEKDLILEKLFKKTIKD